MEIKHHFHNKNILSAGLSNEVINYYLLSLAVADLLCGLFVVPLSVYPAITGRWMFGDLMCRLAGYVEVTLWSVSVYTFMWISVDRYLAVRKPLRYETVSATVAISFFITSLPQSGRSGSTDIESLFRAVTSGLHQINTVSFSVLSSLLLNKSFFLM